VLVVLESSIKLAKWDESKLVLISYVSQNIKIVIKPLIISSLLLFSSLTTPLKYMIIFRLVAC
jgi:hypothetical protein